MGVWDVKKDEDRQQWSFIPLAAVGPLRFGMPPDEVSAALAPATESGSTGISSEKGCAMGLKTILSSQRFTEPGITAYYGRSERLAAVAIDALQGPQVLLSGEPLVGRVPSIWEEWFCEHIAAHDFDLLYTHEGNPASADLGLIMRVQRAGDAVLTRPILALHEWVDDSWDFLPGEEWRTFSSRR